MRSLKMLFGRRLHGEYRMTRRGRKRFRSVKKGFDFVATVGILGGAFCGLVGSLTGCGNIDRFLAKRGWGVGPRPPTPVEHVEPLHTKNYAGRYRPADFVPREKPRKPSNNWPVTPVDHSRRERYAVLLNGSTSLATRNAYLALKALLKKGFRNENLFVVSGRDFYATGKVNAATRRPGTRENLEQVFDLLGRVVDSNDLLILYLTGHGMKGKTGYFVDLQDGLIPAERLVALVQSLKAQDVIVVSDNCFSGGIVRGFSALKRGVVTLSSCDPDQVSYGAFAPEFWNSVGDAAADRDKDGTVTLKEAFDYSSEAYRRLVAGRGDRIDIRGRNPQGVFYASDTAPTTFD